MKLKIMSEKVRRSLDNVLRFTSMVGEGSTFEGHFTGDDNYIVNGLVNGTCDLEGTLVIMENGQWKGNIKARIVVIGGKVDGIVEATEKVELRSTANIVGDIISPVIAIANGAVFDGEMHMHDKEPKITHYEEQRVSP